MDRCEADIAGALPWWGPIREPPAEALRRCGQRRGVEAPPLLVTPQNRVVTDVEAKAARVNHQLGQHSDVPYAKIETLAGDRVDHVCRLADERQPGCDIALRQQQRERVSPARPNRLDGAEKIAKARRELFGKYGIGERHQPRYELGPFGPYDGGTVCGHRQYGKGGRRQEGVDRDTP